MEKGMEVLAETLLWSVISEKVEDIKQLSNMMSSIGYLPDLNNVIASITHCELFDSESFDITYSIHEDKTIIEFSMPAIVMAYVNKDVQLRITTTVYGQCQINIADIEAHPWQTMDNLKLLSHRGLVENVVLMYKDSECDDLQA